MINYLRISVTDRCNLNCGYCRPTSRVQKLSRDELLTYEDIERFATIAARAGIQYVRLTGGEPLIRKDLPVLIRKLKNIFGIKEVTLTTNGLELTSHLSELVDAGLDRVNISLDTLNSERFKELTGCDRGDAIPTIWQGIMRSLEYGLNPKINVVLFKGVNDDEIEDFARLTINHPLTIRFIEHMTQPFQPTGLTPQVTKVLGERFGVEEENVRVVGRGPARYLRLKGGRGLIGFINPVSDCFCDTCTRLRLTSDGKIYPCIFASSQMDTRQLNRDGCSDDVIGDHLNTFLQEKPRFRKDSKDLNYPGNLDMCYLGG